MNSGNDRDTDTNTEIVLFMTGDSPRSVRARANLEEAVAQLTNSGITVRHVDLLQDTEGVWEYGIIATPALILVRESGEPDVLYGDLSDETELQRFLNDLDGRMTA